MSAQKIDDGFLRSHWGEPREVSPFSVSMQIGAYQFPALLVIGDDVGDEIVLERNVA